MSYIDLPLMERAIETFLWNGMNERGGRAHTMVVRDGRITENDIMKAQVQRVTTMVSDMFQNSKKQLQMW